MIVPEVAEEQFPEGGSAESLGISETVRGGQCEKSLTLLKRRPIHHDRHLDGRREEKRTQGMKKRDERIRE